jgi:hypothetical protein
MKAWLAALTLVVVSVALDAPTITGVSPASPAPSDRPQTITVTGTEFQEGLKLIVTGPDGDIRTFAGQDLQTRREATFQATLTFPTGGTYSLVVLNPDGSKSSPFAVRVKSSGGSGPRPTVDQVSPAETAKDTREQTVTLSGSNFAAGATLSVTDPAGTVSTIRTLEKSTPQTIVARLMLDQPGNYSIVVVNPDGEASNPVTIKVN